MRQRVYIRPAPSMGMAQCPNCGGNVPEPERESFRGPIGDKHNGITEKTYNCYNCGTIIDRTDEKGYRVIDNE